MEEVKLGQEAKEGLAKALADYLTECGFTSTVRGSQESSESGVTAAAKKKRNDRLQRLKDSGNRVAVAWTLAAVCLVGHLTHMASMGMSLPGWLCFFSSVPFHAALCMVSLLGPGRRLLQDGFASMRRGAPNMNTLVGLGALSSFSVSTVAVLLPGLGWPSFFEEPVMLLAFVLLGRAVEEKAKLQASSDMTALFDLIPQQARLVLSWAEDPASDPAAFPEASEKDKAPQTVDVPTSSLKRGDTVLVLPGDRIPVDGIVRGGRSTVDESSITGEAMPVLKRPGDEVSAGAVNLNGAMSVESVRAGEETAVSHIVQMVEEAQSRQAPVQRLADEVAGKFCYGVMGLSAATFAFWSLAGPQLFPAVMPAGGPILLALQLACNVLVVACPCALGLATPTAVLVGTSLGARRGLLIRGGDVLERMSTVDTMVFDKTGTLTKGSPIVTAVLPPSSDEKTWASAEVNEVLALAAGVEGSTTHPLGKALVRAARASNCRPVQVLEGSFEQEPGSGAMAVVEGRKVAVGTLEWVRRFGEETGAELLASSAVERAEAEAESSSSSIVVYVGVDGQLAGVVMMEDQIRDEAPSTIRALQDLGFRTAMLSGDKEGTARAVAKRVGIAADLVYARVRPDEKASFVTNLQQEQRSVAVIGDGVNDAAALAQADVGIAMASGVGAASEVASMVLMGDRLNQAVEAVELSRATMRKVRQNLAWAFLYNVVGVPIAAGVLLPITGTLLTPSIAGAMMGVSSLGVMANSLTLRLEMRHKWRTDDERVAEATRERDLKVGRTAPLLGSTSGVALEGAKWPDDEPLRRVDGRAELDVESGLFASKGKFSH
eukprot:TRINITY_DN16469_c0_g1_i1.p1 TRINITY_DN16469_c0_g1~~TRINITY_DN16469_c0_g1_i1.p1  ORF type:complete len:911 (-),score=203.42 TRINITY_DN16469_c0_g1_i1:647-3139(-)